MYHYKLDQRQERLLVRDYESGLKTAIIARKYGISSDTMRRILFDHSVPSRNMTVRGRVNHNKKPQDTSKGYLTTSDQNRNNLAVIGSCRRFILPTFNQSWPKDVQEAWFRLKEQHNDNA